MSLQELFISFASEIISENSSLLYDDMKNILSKKENKQKFKEFLSINKIKQKKEKKELSDKPKRPSTAYIKFCSDKREEFVSSNPTAENKEITSLMAKEWDDVKVNQPDIFEKYNSIAIQEKAVYEDKMREYRLKHNILEKVKKVSKPKVEKARTPSYYYTKDREIELIAEFPSMKKNEINEKIKKEWKEFKAEKDETFKKYKLIAKEKKCELFASKNLSTPLPNSLNSSPILDRVIISPIRSQPLSPNISSPVKRLDMTMSSPDNSPLVEIKKKVKKINHDDAEKKKKKKKKLIKKKNDDGDNM